MLADLDETIRQLLIAEMPVRNDEIEISFHQPKREWSSKLSRPTVNFFLYDVRENPTLRQSAWERLPGRESRDGQAHLKRTPYRVDCTYLVTTWATEPDDEHQLLARCLMPLLRNPVLPEDRLLGELQRQPFEIQARLAAHDHLTNPAEVWSALDNELRPSISYIITLALDPWQEVTGLPVRSLLLHTGQAAGSVKPSLDPRAGAAERIWIGGRVRSRSGEAGAMPGVRVSLRGAGLWATTDQNGQFHLGPLSRGEYTLIGWPEKGQPVEKQISVPAGDGDYDLELA